LAQAPLQRSEPDWRSERKTARAAFAEMPENERFPFSTNDAKSCLDPNSGQGLSLLSYRVTKKCLLAHRL
jgi:hypothetical protein